MLRHIVLFVLRDDVTDDQIDEAVLRLRTLAVIPGIESLRVERSLDERKGRIIVEDSTFTDTAALEAFRIDPRHEAVSEIVDPLAVDWWIADYQA